MTVDSTRSRADMNRKCLQAAADAVDGGVLTLKPVQLRSNLAVNIPPEKTMELRGMIVEDPVCATLKYCCEMILLCLLDCTLLR